MIRVPYYFDKRGARHENTGRLLAPFGLMKNDGDWFRVRAIDVGRKPEGLAGMCTKYGQRFGCRFEFRTVHFDQERCYQVTRVDGPSSGQPRVEFFTDANGQQHPNDTPDRYPFALLGVGDWFELDGTYAETKAALSALKKAERECRASFDLHLPPDAHPRVTRLG